MTVNQGFGYIFGGLYALIGVAGFAVTGGVPFAGTDGNELLLFELNPLHNLVHIVIGLAFVGGAAAGPSTSRLVNGGLGASYLLVGILGLFMVGETWNFLALNQADNWLHFVSALVAIGISLFPGRAPARA